VSEVSRRADCFPRLSVNNHEPPARFHRLPEELPKRLLPVSIAGRVLLPDQRIRSDEKQFIPIPRPKRSKLQRLADQLRLQFKSAHTLLPQSGRRKTARWQNSGQFRMSTVRLRLISPLRK